MWRKKHPEKQKALNQKYLPRIAAKYVERYTYDDEFREKEKERQRIYYAENWKKILERIRRRKMAKRAVL